MVMRKRVIWRVFSIIFLIIVGYKIYQYSTAYEHDCRELSDEVVITIDNLSFIQKGGTINDVSCLNQTPVYGIVRIKTIEDIQNAVLYAKKNNLKISIAGARHSMGGQAFAHNALILDMVDYNKAVLDESHQWVTVESGMLWHDLQYFLHKEGLAVKAMQSSSIFTVGGSVSVNAHGMDFRVGSVASTIRSMRIVDAQGTIQTISRSENPELFKAVVGGYGLFGVIADVTLSVTPNIMLDASRSIVAYHELPELFNSVINADPSTVLFYAHLSTEPKTFLKEAIVYRFNRIVGYKGEIPPLKEVEKVNIRRFIFNLSKPSYFGKKFKWFAEKYLDKETQLKKCSITDQGDLGYSCLQSRNSVMHDAVEYLRNKLRNEVDILQEYFIPMRNFVPFIDDLRNILKTSGIVTLNVSVRVVHPEDMLLSYANQTMFAIVLYLNQQTSTAGIEKMKGLTHQLIDLSFKHGGTFFLPYQLYYTKEQLIKGYPTIGKFFALKREYDPTDLFTNLFYQKYALEDFKG